MPSQAIEYLTIQGFKSIASVEKLAIRPINVVIGSNGSGKSNLLNAFKFLRAIRVGSLTGYVAAAGGAEKVLHFGSKTTKRIRIEAAFQGGEPSYSHTLNLSANDSLVDPLWPRNISTMVERSCEPERWCVYHLNDTGASSPLRVTTRVHDNRHLREDGSNLPAFLYLLHERYEDAYRSIVYAINQIAPFFLDFNLAPLQLNPDTIKLEWRHKRSDQYFDASALSDGTLRFIALATLFLQPEEVRPSLILVDEPELGLHPSALELLAALIRQASVETQVIVATQSPLLLDHFNPEDVIVADLVDDSTQLSRLDPDRLAKWLDDYSLGQLWEKNEFGGRPVVG